MSASEGLKTPTSSFILENVVAKALAPAPVPRAIPVMSSPPRSSEIESTAKDSGREVPPARTPVLARAILSRAAKSPEAFRTISEVADDLKVPQHVLRFWETKFSAIRPLKRGGGRRYYRPEDVNLLKRIHELLYTQGYTIKGAQKLLKGTGRSGAAALGLTESVTLDKAAPDRGAGLESHESQDAEAFPEHRGELLQPVVKEEKYSRADVFGAEAPVSGRLSPAQREGLQAILAELTTLRTLLAVARA